MVKDIHKSKKAPKEYKFEIDHNPYMVTSYNNTSSKGKVILFPIFHYEGERQYMDLLNPLLEKGYHIVTINLLSKGDRALFLNYYAKAFLTLIDECIKNKIVKNEQIIIMGFGVGAYIASYIEKSKLKGITKVILLSPVNKYKDEYTISKEIAKFKLSTYIFFGQNDSVVNVDSRFMIFENGRKNKKVTFTTYPVVGHYLYYDGKTSLDIEEKYRKSDVDLFEGENSRSKASYLPERINYNEKFFSHLYSVLEDEPLKKRIALLTDVFPLFINGVSTVVNLLKRELDNLGYETYIVALWDKKVSLDKLPEGFIPVPASRVNFVKGHKDLHLLKSFVFQKNAKMLSTFGFNYLHLHTEYTMAQIAVLLSKYTGIKMVYTYHTLWKLYYEQKFGKVAGDFTYKAAKELLFSKAYKECPTIIVPSKKTYDILMEEGSSSKDIRIIPSSIDFDRFKLKKDDLVAIRKLKDKYKLNGKKVLGYVGRVSLEKNIAETLDYIANIKSEIPNIIFMIVGEGDASKSLHKQVKKLKLEDNVIFVGQVDNDKLKLYYPLFDVFVTASNFETQGLTYFEAATCGTLILAKEDKALEGVFVDNENAYIYKDFYQWAERIEKALFKNNKRITDNAKKTMQQFTPDKWAKKISDIYIELNNK